MTQTTRRLAYVSTLPEAVDLLAQVRGEDEGAVRYEVGLVQAPEPLAWIARQRHDRRCCWAARDGGLELVGLGTALEVAGDLALARREFDPAAPGWRWLGGQAFDPSAPVPPEWEGFGTGCFRIPRLSLERSVDGATLALHLVDDGNREAELRDARRLLGGLDGGPRRMRLGRVGPARIDAPDRGGWSMLYWGARAALASGELRKVVVARRSEVHLSAPADPFELLAGLLQPRTARFAFEAAPGRAFVVCTPELLYERKGQQLQSEAIAGTRTRGADPEVDRAQAADLLGSDKERREHQHVVEAIETALGQVCDRVERPAMPQVLRLRSVMHLRTPFSAHLARGVGDEELVQSLHPTPAVCGQPREPARAFIAANEPFGRGWYAGPVGVAGSNEACFAVGIRSGLLVGDRVLVYAGAGLVAGSDPGAEWREVESKSRPFLASAGATTAWTGDCA